MVPPTHNNSKRSSRGSLQMPNFFNCGPLTGTSYGATTTTTHPSNTATRSTYSSTAGEHFEASKQRVLNFVDGFMSPLKACVVPPLQACVAPDDGRVWDPACGGDNTNPAAAAAAMRCTHPYEFPLCGSDVNIATSNSSTNAVSSSSTPSSSSSPSRTLQPNPNDILLGRGKNSCQHPGNTNFRKLIAANRPMYAHLTKKQKMMVARQIVDIIHHTDPPGRFLAREHCTSSRSSSCNNNNNKVGSPSSSSSSSAYWVDVGLPRSLEKTSQALRDRHSSTTSETTNDSNNHGDEDHPMEGVTTTTTTTEMKTNPERKSRSRVVEVPEIVIPRELAGIYRLPRPRDTYRDRSAPPYAHAMTTQPPPPYSTHHHHPHHPYPLNPHPHDPAVNASRMPSPSSQSLYPGEAVATSRIPSSYPLQGRPYYAADQSTSAVSLPLQPIPQVTPSRNAYYVTSAPISSTTKTTTTTHQAYPGGTLDQHQTPNWNKRQRTVDPQVVTSAIRVAPQQQSDLTHVMQSRLSLEERVVAPPPPQQQQQQQQQQYDQSLQEPIELVSPSSLLLARRSSRRRRRMDEHMDGLAALSTAAFLRLDDDDDDDDDDESNF